MWIKINFRNSKNKEFLLRIVGTDRLDLPIRLLFIVILFHTILFSNFNDIPFIMKYNGTLDLFSVIHKSSYE